MEDESIEELRIALLRIARRLRAEKADDQLGETHSTVLMLLARQGAYTLRGLSDFLRVTPPSMSQTIDSLVGSGLVSREPDPEDGRRVLIVATPAGLAYANETSLRRHQWLAAQLEGLSKADTQALLRATRVLQQIAGG